jgi:hypothetical protein
VYPRRHRIRKWRLRGRRGQVSAVATILGLLLVVTYIANYITTTLPQQMSINDLNHDVQVEDQLGGLQALIGAAVASNAIGAQFSQPVTLGGVGQPPFAGPDSGWIGPGNTSGGFNVNFTVTIPPTPIGGGVVQDGAAGTGACTAAPSVRCAAGTWFTLAVTPTVANDLLVVSLSVYEQSTALTTADIADSAGSTWTLQTPGGNAAPGPNPETQYVYTTIDAGAVADTITVGAPVATGLTAHDASGVVFALKNVNTVTPVNAVGGFATGTGTTASNTIAAPAFGLVLGVVSTGQAASSAFPTITAGSAGTPCTATCTTVGSETGENWGVTYIESEPATAAGTYTASATLSISEGWGELTLAINPLLSSPPVTAITTGASSPGSTVVVHLRNTYVPTAEVAFDEGGVIFAQPGTAPILVDPPAFSFGQSSMSLLVPVFVGQVAVESGLSTTDLQVRLVSIDTYLFPNAGLNLQAGSDVTLSVKTPYWAAWMTYFGSQTSLTGDFTCKNLAGVVCPAVTADAYAPGGPLAIVTVSVPATSLSLQVATFALGET